MAVKFSVPTKELAHKHIVTNAAYAYVNYPGLTLTGLSNMYNESVSTISEWLVEAFKEGFITGHDNRAKLAKKHITEYESKFDIYSLSLRNSYKFPTIVV